MALGPEARLVLSLVVDKGTDDATVVLTCDFRRRAGGRVMRRMTSNEHQVCESAIRAVYGQVVIPPRTGCPGRPRHPYIVMPPAVTYATVHEVRENRVVRMETRLEFGTWLAVALAFVASAVSRAVNTCFVERHNGTDRKRSGHKVRKSCALSKDGETHRAATRVSYFGYNFCGSVVTLRHKEAGGRWRQRVPAMAVGLTDHVRTLAQWLASPAVQRK